MKPKPKYNNGNVEPVTPAGIKDRLRLEAAGSRSDPTEPQAI